MAEDFDGEGDDRKRRMDRSLRTTMESQNRLRGRVDRDAEHDMMQKNLHGLTGSTGTRQQFSVWRSATGGEEEYEDNDNPMIKSSNWPRGLAEDVEVKSWVEGLGLKREDSGDRPRETRRRRQRK